MDFGGLVAGVALVLATQAVTHYFQRSRTLKDKLLERYSELAGTAVALIEVARSIEAEFALKPRRDDPESDRWKKTLIKLYEERQGFVRDLARIAVQIRMLELDEMLREKVKQLAKDQPFLAPGEWGEVGFDERFERYKTQTREYARQVDGLTQAVLLKHSRVNRFAFWNRFRPRAVAG